MRLWPYTVHRSWWAHDRLWDPLLDCTWGKPFPSLIFFYCAPILLFLSSLCPCPIYSLSFQYRLFDKRHSTTKQMFTPMELFSGHSHVLKTPSAPYHLILYSPLYCSNYWYVMPTCYSLHIHWLCRELLTQKEPYGGMEGLKVAYAVADSGLRPTIPRLVSELFYFQFNSKIYLAAITPSAEFYLAQQCLFLHFVSWALSSRCNSIRVFRSYFLSFPDSLWILIAK